VRLTSHDCGSRGPDRQLRAVRTQFDDTVEQAEADFDPLPFDAGCARAFGRVAASLRRPGRKAQARAYDALIAATALANARPVYTRNPDDFGASKA
jgi:predicted nucleic acid-binding protein